MKTFGTIILLLALPLLALAQTNVPTGRVVWWGRDMIQRSHYSNHTNGIIENDNEILSNVVAIAGNTWQGLLLKNDGTVFGIGNNFQGGNDIPSGLTNVISIAAEGGSYWSIRADGSMARWGNEQDEENVVAGLSNIVSVTWAGYRNYLALKTDGTVLGFRFDNPRPLVEEVEVGGQIMSNVVALAALGYTPLVLKNDGTVFDLGYQTPSKPPVQPSYEVHSNVLYEYLGAESAQLPYQYTSAEPVIIDGQALSNVVSLASGGGHALALKKDGAVVAWGNNSYDAATVPAGISNVITIAATENESLALKRDGTVVAWGNNHDGQTSVPDGLSNVVAIASAGDFSLAITTGNIPSSVFIQPHGRLEEMEQEADLVFKGQVISDSAITNVAFPDWGKPHATEFNVISVFKGNIRTNVVTFLHITGGPGAWSGSRPPQEFIFDVGRSYLVFAMQSDKADWLYSPSTNGVAKPNEFRQIMRGEIPIRTLDNRPLNDLSEKEAHWFELNLLLNDSNPTNQLYAIDKLDSMSLTGKESDEWAHSDDFKRKRVLSAIFPLTTNRNERVAARASSCFPDQKQK